MGLMKLVKISSRYFKQFVRLCNDNNIEEATKGKALEDMVSHIFNRIPGVGLKNRDQKNVFEDQEIDLVFWNDQDSHGLKFLPFIILVECKNWSKPVGADEVKLFDRKLDSNGIDIGVFIVTSRITGTTESLSSAHKTIADALREKRRIIVLSVDEIKIINDTSQLVELFKKKLCDLAVRGTTIT
jgi:restriction endonuclease Mrr